MIRGCVGSTHSDVLGGIAVENVIASEGLKFLNHERCWKKVIFMLTAMPFASIDIPVMGRGSS